MEIETKFRTLDDKESSFEKVVMPKTVVFYPYFHYKPLKDTGSGKPGDGGVDRAYKLSLDLTGFSLAKLADAEKDLYEGRHNEYGFWTAKMQDGCFIGLGAKSLPKLMDGAESAEAFFVMLHRDDTVMLFRIRKTASGVENPMLDIYFSDSAMPCLEKLAWIKDYLAKNHLWEGGEELKAQATEFTVMKYTYYNETEKPVKVERNRFAFPAQEPKTFLENVHGCTWHTIVLDDNVINEGPRFVLLKNSGMKLGNILDDLSCILVHRRGGFVMGKEFASSDFHQETTYTIREVDEYVYDDVVILNIECDTYTNNRDEGLEKFLKGLSEKRFHRH